MSDRLRHDRCASQRHVRPIREWDDALDLCCGRACRRTRSPASDGAGKTTLRWAAQGDALTYDPHAQNESPTNAANNQVYDTLVSRDTEMAREPALATSWENVEPTVWEFKLREGVKFHEGQDFSADDVVFS